MMTSLFLLAAVTVLPSDRMAMADRLFNRGKYAEAQAEYRALQAEKDIARDEIVLRLAECDRVAGRTEEALKGYAKHPEHVAVANGKVRPYTVQRTCLDYEF